MVEQHSLWTLSCCPQRKSSCRLLTVSLQETAMLSLPSSQMCHEWIEQKFHCVADLFNHMTLSSCWPQQNHVRDQKVKKIVKPGDKIPKSLIEHREASQATRKEKSRRHQEFHCHSVCHLPMATAKLPTTGRNSVST